MIQAKNQNPREQQGPQPGDGPEHASLDEDFK